MSEILFLPSGIAEELIDKGQFDQTLIQKIEGDLLDFYDAIEADLEELARQGLDINDVKVVFNTERVDNVVRMTAKILL